MNARQTKKILIRMLDPNPSATLSSTESMNTHRLSCKCRQANTMPQAIIGTVYVVVTDGSMTRDPVVPDAHGAIVPFDANLEISRDGNVL